MSYFAVVLNSSRDWVVMLKAMTCGSAASIIQNRWTIDKNKPIENMPYLKL